MKWGSLEGTPQEIRDFFEANAAQFSDYFQKLEEPLGWIWILIPAVLVGLSFSSLAVWPELGKHIAFLVFLLGLGALVWLTISVQVKFKNPWASFVAAVGGLLILLMAAGFMAPKEAIDALRTLKSKGSD